MKNLCSKVTCKFLTGILLVAFGVLGAACEKPTKENLDKWTRTEKGPQKIKDALANSELGPDLRARAARNLVRMEDWVTVKDTLGKTPDAEREPMVSALAKELWEDAKNFPDRRSVPTPLQTQAKDALFELRTFASDDTRKTIDGYLVEWLSGYYEGRSMTGRILGRTIVREITRGLLGILKK